MTASSTPFGGRPALVAVSLGVFCVQLDAFALNLALPRIGRGLEVSGGDLQWVVSAYLLSAGTLMLGAGRLGDLLGRRRSLVAGLVLFGTASLACALAPTLAALVAARVLQGAGGALIMPVGLALLTNVFPPGLRGRATGCALGVAGVATACGPFVGGALTQAVSWRAVFWINVPLAALAAVWAYRAPESRDTSTAAGLDWPGLISGTAASAAMVVFVDRGQVWGWMSGGSTAVLGLATVLLVAFVSAERRASNPLVKLVLFRNGPYVALTAAGAVANAATVVFLFVVPLSLQGPWELPAGAAGVAFLVPASVMAAAGPVAGRVRPSRAVVVMAVCLGAGAAALYAVPSAVTLPAYLLAITACGAALGLANALTLTATQAVIRPERAGEASGVTKTVITVTGGLGVMLAGAAEPTVGPVSTADTTLAVAGTGCLVACLTLAIGMCAPACPE